MGSPGVSPRANGLLRGASYTGAADGMATDAGADLGFDLDDDVSEPPSKKQRAESVEVAADDGSDFGL